MGWSELMALATTNRVITYADARACGVPASTLDDHARRYGWPDRPEPGCFVLPGTKVDGVVRAIAAYRSVPGALAVGGDAALALHGLVRTMPTRIDVWVPDAHRGRARPTRRVRRTSLLRAHDTVPVEGIRVVHPAWALRDVAATRDLDALRHLAIDARFRRLIRDGDLEHVVRRDPHFGGRGRLRQVTTELHGDGSDSGFEHTARERLTAVGLPPDPGQRQLWTPGGVRRLDLPYALERVGVECLGWAYHHDRAQLDRDAERTNDIAAVDAWLILELTWSMLHGRGWERFVARLTTALESRRRRLRER